MRADGKELLTIHVASADELEKAAYVICLRECAPSQFTDNETGTCSHCGHAVFFRPYMPKTPPRICLQCVSDIAQGGHA